MFLFVFTVMGCKKKVDSYSEIKRIVYSEILNQKANKDQTYLVFIYSTTCSFCEELEPTIVEYYNRVRSKQFLGVSCSNFVPIYVLNLNATKENKGILASSDAEYENFVGTTQYQDIRFSTAPAMIEVTNHTVTKLISSKTTDYPVSEIRQIMKQLLN